MPIETIELFKLVIGAFIIVLPGYLWSHLFFKDLKPFERLTFGFMSGLGVICLSTFVLDMVFKIIVTQVIVIAVFAVYTIPALVSYILYLLRHPVPKPKYEHFKNPKTLFLILILGFSVFMTLLPHWSDNYFLPFHVDEWQHWCYGNAVIESGSSAFPNPYGREGTVQSLEPGFHFILASLIWMTTTDFVTIFVFMPSIIAVFTSLAAFNIGERAKNKFGLEAAFLVPFIPTTCRLLGPSFLVPVTFGLLSILFLIWLCQLRKTKALILIPLVIWCTFLIHPPTALACIIISLIFYALLLLEKEYKLPLLGSILILLPILIVFLLSTRWEKLLQHVLDTFVGGKYSIGLTKVWVSFEHIGYVVWVLFALGIYLSFTRGKTTLRTLSFSALAFVTVIGLYDKFNYGIPVMYERSFLYLFLMVTLIAGYGMHELRKIIRDLLKKPLFKKYKHIVKHSAIIAALLIPILLIATAVPAHLDIEYYHMIDEEEYKTFIWMRENLDDFRDENHSYDRCAIDPFKASPLSAVTKLCTIFSTMHPLYSYMICDEIKSFLKEGCINTSFLEKHRISVIYGECNNEDLMMIHPKVYLYPGLYEKET
jgi:hypothetical protein